MSFKLSLALFLATVLTFLIVKTTNGQVPGGVSSISPDDERMLKVLKNAIYMYNKQEHQGMTHHMTLGKVREAREQVVAGMKYVVDFDFLHTKCKKEEKYLSRPDFDRCQHDKSRKTHKCQTTLFHQPWNREAPITIDELTCENQYWS